MKKTLPIIFFTLLSAHVFAQKETQEFPWSRAAKIMDANEAKTSTRRKTERPSEADTKKPERKEETDNKKSK
jgi:hypothetical protein